MTVVVPEYTPPSSVNPQAMATAAQGVSSALAMLPNVPLAARMAVPAAIVLLVSRKTHPFVWWAFGAGPLAYTLYEAVKTRGRK